MEMRDQATNLDCIVGEIENKIRIVALQWPAALTLASRNFFPVKICSL